MTATIIRAGLFDGASGLCHSFAPFGKVVAIGARPMIINNGYARKHRALAVIDAAADGKSRMHLFAPKPRIPPIPITMMERHPKGAQCFVPLGGDGWLALVADDDGAGAPGALSAFGVCGDIGLCYDRNIWHFPLLALSGQHFAVADNGDSDDLQEHYFDTIRWLMHSGGGAAKDKVWQTMEELGENGFMDMCGGIAEESPWVAKLVWQNRDTLASEADLATAFALVILQADDDRQLQLIRNHPPLATKIPLSAHSASEQNAAGLANLPAQDDDIFAKLNGEYAARFGFPFVCAVGGLSAADILAEIQRRTNNTAANAAICERGEALYQIFHIIRRRLSALPL
ncbi:MAG: 2-oxo-4-hydroxy-4-carboxy-5-ureidoimidazoline decarboxylase [Gammaproteobacteria bacterium]